MTRDVEALAQALETGLRSLRHTHDAMWTMHTQESMHRRARLADTNLAPCAVCIGLAGSVVQLAAALAAVAALAQPAPDEMSWPANPVTTAPAEIRDVPHVPPPFIDDQPAPDATCECVP